MNTHSSSENGRDLRCDRVAYDSLHLTKATSRSIARIQNARMFLLDAVAGRQNHTRSVVLSVCCLVSIICDVGKTSSKTLPGMP